MKLDKTDVPGNQLLNFNKDLRGAAMNLAERTNMTLR